MSCPASVSTEKSLYLLDKKKLRNSALFGAPLRLVYHCTMQRHREPENIQQSVIVHFRNAAWCEDKSLSQRDEHQKVLSVQPPFDSLIYDFLLVHRSSPQRSPLVMLFPKSFEIVKSDETPPLL